MYVSRTGKMLQCAMFAALTAVLSQIAIPIGPVPINLATFAVFCAGAMLGPRLGAASLGVWALLGAVGVPVFSLFRGGLGMLFGPTGGYIVGYIPAAFLIGLILEKYNSQNKPYLYPVAMTAGLITYFTIGTAWYMYLTATPFVPAFMACVAPFLPGDFAKMAAAVFVAYRLNPILNARYGRNSFAQAIGESVAAVQPLPEIEAPDRKERQVMTDATGTPSLAGGTDEQAQ